MTAELIEITEQETRLDPRIVALHTTGVLLQDCEGDAKKAAAVHAIIGRLLPILEDAPMTSMALGSAASGE